MKRQFHFFGHFMNFATGAEFFLVVGDMDPFDSGVEGSGHVNKWSTDRRRGKFCQDGPMFSAMLRHANRSRAREYLFRGSGAIPLPPPSTKHNRQLYLKRRQHPDFAIDDRAV